MATKTIVTCDLCGTEITPNVRTVYFSAARYDDQGTGVVVSKFDLSEFCGDGCVLAAVRGLLNGAA